MTTSQPSNYLAGADTAWRQISSRFLQVRLDVKGAFLGEAGVSTLPEKEALLQVFKRRRNLADCFDMQGFRDCGAAANSGRLFQCRPGVLPSDSEAQFVTDLPVYALSINVRGNGAYLGVVSPLRVAPNLLFHEAGGICYVDRHDRLRGYNPFFQALFHAPSSLLGRPLKTLVAPSPLTIRKNALEQDSATPFPDYPLIFDTGKKEYDNSDGLENQLMMLPPVLTLPENAFEYELSYEVIKGDAPLLVVRAVSGGQGEEYLLGPSARREGTVVVKKHGCVVADGAGCPLSTPGLHRIAWRFRNGSFRLMRSNAECFAYHDFDFPTLDKAQVGLSIRPNSRVLLRRLALKSGPAVLPMAQGPHVVKLCHAPSRAFVLHMVYHPVLASVFPDITGYTLHEVSRLEAEVRRLNRLYTAEQAEGVRLRQKLSGVDDTPRLLGESPAMQRLKTQALQLADSDAALVLEGETGTGKEVLAGLIHRQSAFSAGPFVKVDCSSLPAPLLESELFGVEKGAYTGAQESRPGKFELAEGGTLFLDEINNLPLSVQAKLLGFLQDLTVTRLGSQKPRRLRLRVIAASNIPLSHLVRKGLFREDLYYRIQVATLVLPRLRDRKEDIPELAVHFLKQFAGNYNRKVVRLSPAALVRLMQWEWPGNVRELKNEVQRAVIFAKGPDIEADDIAVGNQDKAGYKDEVTGVKRLELDQGSFEALLRKHKGNLKALARELKCVRSTVYYNLRKFNLDPEFFR